MTVVGLDADISRAAGEAIAFQACIHVEVAGIEMKIVLATRDLSPAFDDGHADGAQVCARAHVQVVRKSADGDVQLDEKIVELVAGLASAGQLLNQLAEAQKESETYVAEEKAPQVLVAGRAVDDAEGP